MSEKQVRARYTQEFKLEAVRQVRAGQAIAVVAKVLGMPKASLSNWVRQSAKGDLSAAGAQDEVAKVSAQQMELARLRAENARLRIERDIAKKGSSRNTGEGGPNLEEEVLLIAVAIGSALDDLDGVVDALDHAGVERVTTARQDAVPIALQALGEELQCGDGALLGLLAPLFPGSGSPRGLAVEPQPFELVAQQVHAQQRLIGGQQLLQPHRLLGRQIGAIAQQQPAAGLQDPPSRPVMAQPIGLIHPHTVDYLPSVLGHDMEQVVHHLGLGAMRLDLQFVGRRHVDGHGFDALGHTRGPSLSSCPRRLA